MAKNSAQILVELIDRASAPAREIAKAVKAIGDKNGTRNLGQLNTAGKKLDATFHPVTARFGQTSTAAHRLAVEVHRATAPARRLATANFEAARSAREIAEAIERADTVERVVHRRRVRRATALDRRTEIASREARRERIRQRRGLVETAEDGIPGGGMLSRFGAGAIGITGGAVGAGLALRKAARSSMSFERSMIEVGKATDSSGTDLDAYGEKVMTLARQTGKTKEELASILSSAGFAGRPKEELMDFTEYSAKAMVAWQTSADETGQALAEIGNIYEANQKRIEGIGDAINTMADNSASKETDLLEFMRRAGASSRQAGISAEHMLAFGAALKEVGVRNEVAATGFEALLNVMKLGEEFSKKAGEGLEGLGVNSTKMRRAFVAKPVETMIGLLEKLNKVSDPLKKAEIMTNLFGKEYQDDIAKLLNALPKLQQYIGLMSDANKLASGGVRVQFAQNLDKDVIKIDRATQAIDVLAKRAGDPIKVRLGMGAEAINEVIDRFETSMNVFQRFTADRQAYRRAMGLPEEKPLQPESREGDDLMAPVRRAHLDFQDWIGGKAGAYAETNAEVQRAARERAQREKHDALYGEPGRVQTSLDEQRTRRDRAREVERSGTGPARTMAGREAGRADAEIKRLEERLERAFDAIGDVRAREKREAGSFGLGGATGKDSEGIGPGRFGLGLHGTDTFAPRKVPLPPKRPAGLGERSPADVKVDVDQKQIEQVRETIDQINAKTIAPKAVTSSLDTAKGVADTTKAALEALAMSVTPNVETGPLQAALSLARALNAELAKTPGLSAGAQAGAQRMRSSALSGYERSKQTSMTSSPV